MGLSRRQFTKEFKLAAIQRLEMGASLAEVARAFEVNPSVLHRWRREVRQGPGNVFPGLAVAEQASIGSARDLLAKGQLREAAVVLRHVVVADPGNFDARTLLGTTLALQGIRSESIEQLVEAVHLRPKSAEAYNTLGMVLSRFVETKAAREAFENALALNPHLAEVRINLALLQAQAGEFEPAGENLDYAIQLQGDT